MDIKIRGVSSKVISEIDRRCEELTKKTQTKWSRNDYLKLLLENDFDRPLMKYKQDQFDKFISKTGEILDKNTVTIQEYIDTTNQLIELLISNRSEG